MSKAHAPSKYIKKPLVVMAMEFRPRARMWPPNVYQTGYKSFVTTANGNVEIEPGDFICWQYIKGKRDVWPVKANIFHATYEKMGER